MCSHLKDPILNLRAEESLGPSSSGSGGEAAYAASTATTVPVGPGEAVPLDPLLLALPVVSKMRRNRGVC